MTKPHATPEPSEMLRAASCMHWLWKHRLTILPEELLFAYIMQGNHLPRLIGATEPSWAYTRWGIGTRKMSCFTRTRCDDVWFPFLMSHIPLLEGQPLGLVISRKRMVYLIVFSLHGTLTILNAINASNISQPLIPF